MVLISQNVAILDSLRAAQSFTAQAQALHALKNETVGHILKKEKWVELGVLRPVVKVLLHERPLNWLDGDGRPEHPDTRGPRGSRRPSAVTPPDNLPADDLARLQALELLGIFASGGPTFLAPLHAAGALPAILAFIDPSVSHPRLVYAALRTLSTIIKAARLVTTTAPTTPPPVTIRFLADTLFTTPHLHSLHVIISAAPRTWWVEAITNVAMSLISPLCSEARHQAALAKAGILDALAVKVASYVVARGQVVPGADIIAEREGLRDAIPEPATPRLDMAAVLDALAAIMGDSRLRACMLLYSPSILAIFPQLEFESTVQDVHAAWKALKLGGLSNTDQQMLGALDFLLPAVPSQQSRAHLSHNSPFPPLGMGLSRENLPGLARETGLGKRGPGQPFGWAAPEALTTQTGMGLASDGHVEEPESPMIPWLISLVRSTSGLERLMAASVLTTLYKAGFASKTREAAIALLIVPLLLRMLDDGLATPSGSRSGDGGSGGSTREGPGDRGEEAEAIKQAITETALNVLARLIANSDVLQKAAVEGNAIKTLARLLKEAYEPVSEQASPRPWNPTPTASDRSKRKGTSVAGARGVETHVGDDMARGGIHGDDLDGPVMLSEASKLGPAGQNSLLAYRIRLREAVLKALTALLAVKYDYQNAFVNQEAMVYVVASLSPTPSKPRSGKEKMKPLKEENINNQDDDFNPEYGRNPTGVLVAACNCVRMLSRSIFILRTMLEDAGVAAPIFRFLQHPDIEVQIAATSAVCNLVTETSPMREPYAEAGVMDILCKHAHSQNSQLRLNALWALKHFVDGVEPSVKKMCLEQLESGWLVQLIDPDSESDSTPALFGRSEGYRSGGVSGTLTGAVEEPMDEDIEMDQASDDSDDDGDGDKSIDHQTGEQAGAASTNLDDDSNTGGQDPWAAGGSMYATTGSPSFQRARFPRTIHERSRTGRLRQAEAKIARLREIEHYAQLRSQNDDVVIQEQGLNVIRNLIGPGSSSPTASSSTAPARDPVNEATEMIDHLFSVIGQDRLFQILLSKLKAKVRGPRAASSGDGAGRVQQPWVKIIEAVVFILVHISASVPRHRQLVIAQTELLKALIGQFTSRDKGVRVALCHLVTNLTWPDDQGDVLTLEARVTELRRLGFLGQLERLEEEDPELDVREQAKMATHQMVRLHGQ